MRADGVVVSVDGQFATFSVMQQSACAGCSASCANCHKKVEHCITVENTAGANVGDPVWLESSAARILLICCLIFVIPPVLACVCCALLWNVVKGVPLAIISIAVAAICFSGLYLTVGRKIIADNRYKLILKY